MAGFGDAEDVVLLVRELRDACNVRAFLSAFTAADVLVRRLVTDDHSKVLCIAAKDAGGTYAALLGLQLSACSEFVTCLLGILFHSWGGGLPPFDIAIPPGPWRISTRNIIFALLDAVDSREGGCRDKVWAQWTMRLLANHACSDFARVAFERVTMATTKCMRIHADCVLACRTEWVGRLHPIAAYVSKFLRGGGARRSRVRE